jgi:exodeoxyribonuclease V alpha subunit
VLVVDEASMIDLVLMEALLAALSPHARLALVGDKDQLASVEAGFVFGDLCEAAGGADERSAEARAYYRALSAHDLESSGDAAVSGDGSDTKERSGERAEENVGHGGRAVVLPGPAPGAAAGTMLARLADVAVELEVAWRFRDRPGIGALAAAVRVGDVERTLAVLADDALAEVRREDLPAGPHEVVAAISDALEAVVSAERVEDALARLANVRILCATNRGPSGVETLNRAVERRLADLGHSTAQPWYRGRPVLVTANDYASDLFNGDVGMCFPDDEGAAAVWFAGARGLRAVAPAKLPPRETAWAMTVHKSQGSEFERVMVVLPARDSPLLTRELIYTAVTRARADVTVLADPDVLRAAVERRAERVSGLRDLLVEDRATAPAEGRARA